MFEHVPAVSEVDVLASPDAVAAELATSLPRADDVAALLMLDPEALPDAGRVDLLVAFERHIALLQAGQQQVLASLDGRALDWSGTKLIDYTREQVGAGAAALPRYRRTPTLDCPHPHRPVARDAGATARWAAHLPARHETRRSDRPVRPGDRREDRAAGAHSGAGADAGPIRDLTAAG